MTETEVEINEMLNLTEVPIDSESESSSSSTHSTSIKTTKRSIFTRFLIIFAGFYEGLLLILKYPYVFHIFLLTCLFEIILTVLDYEFKILGSHQTEIQPDTNLGDSSSNNFANLMGHFG